MNAPIYAPGEIFDRIMKRVKVDTRRSAAMNIIFYLEYMLHKMGIKDKVVGLSLNNGEIFPGRIRAADTKQIYVETPTGESLFYAQREGTKPWEIVTFVEGGWQELMEHAYEKINTCMDSVEKFAAEFPPIGVVHRGEE